MGLHYFKEDRNLSTYIGKIAKFEKIVYTLPNSWIRAILQSSDFITELLNKIPFIPDTNIPSNLLTKLPITYRTIAEIINKSINDGGYRPLDFTIAEEPANFLFFDKKYTINIRCFPYTDKAKAECAKMKPIEYTISEEDRAAFVNLR